MTDNNHSTDPIPCKLGWRNPDEDDAMQLRLYAFDQGRSPRWARPHARTVEHALTERGYGEGGGVERQVVVVDAQVWDQRASGTLAIDEDSNLIKHARREFEITGEEPWAVDHLLQVVQAFANAGHSGGSAPWAIAVLERLLRFEPLTDLTDDPADWIEVGEGMWQCRRNGEAFSTDGGKTYTLLSERAALDGDLDLTPLHTSVHRG